DPEKWAPVFGRDKRGTRLRGDHAQDNKHDPDPKGRVNAKWAPVFGRDKSGTRLGGDHAPNKSTIGDGASAPARSASRAVCLWLDQRAFADGREPAAADVSARALCEVRRCPQGRARSVRGRGDGRARPGYFRPQGAGTDAHARRRGGILADPRSGGRRRQPRAEIAGLSRGLRRVAAAHPQAVFKGGRGERVATAAATTFPGCCAAPSARSRASSTRWALAGGA